MDKKENLQNPALREKIEELILFVIERHGSNMSTQDFIVTMWAFYENTNIYLIQDEFSVSRFAFDALAAEIFEGIKQGKEEQPEATT